jgi:hypothetical protein
MNSPFRNLPNSTLSHRHPSFGNLGQIEKNGLKRIAKKWVEKKRPSHKVMAAGYLPAAPPVLYTEFIP